jgi:hypothetical protein
MGYHQLLISPKTQEKLAFQGPDVIKWMYTMMLFGPTNSPTTFIQMIHDLDSAWKDLAAKCGLTIDDDTNTNFVVDNIFNWAPTFWKPYFTWSASSEFARHTGSRLT